VALGDLKMMARGGNYSRLRSSEPPTIQTASQVQDAREINLS
jgi:hypothetical protein